EALLNHYLLRLVLAILVHRFARGRHAVFGRHVVHSIALTALRAIGDVSALVNCRKKAIAPQWRTNRGRHIPTKPHQSGQALIFRAESVSDPGPHGWPSSLIRARIQHQAGGLMVGDFRIYGTNPANIIYNLAQVRPQFT